MAPGNLSWRGGCVVVHRDESLRTKCDSHDGVFAVTVTYGDRAVLLSQMLAATLAQGIHDIVVVDNGAHWDVGSMSLQYPQARLHIVRMGRNTGSAVGFAAGINKAMTAGATMLWLLDDDNRPLGGALRTLLSMHTVQTGGDASALIALLGFRPEHQAEVAAGGAQRQANARNCSFLGFHLLDLPSKLWRKRPWRRHMGSKSIEPIVRLDVAPYSGLLLHRRVVEVIGVPRHDFVLYADDSEWTYRITQRGGAIWLVTGAEIEDMESSWNASHRYKTAMHGLLAGGSDFRVYYGIRNAVNFQLAIARSRALFRLNATVYLSLLSMVALFCGRLDRFRLIKMASSDGMAGRLGQSEQFPL